MFITSYFRIFISTTTRVRKLSESASATGNGCQIIWIKFKTEIQRYTLASSAPSLVRKWKLSFRREILTRDNFQQRRKTPWVSFVTRGIGQITWNVRRRSKSRVLRARLIEIRAMINICIRFIRDAKFDIVLFSENCASDRLYNPQWRFSHLEAWTKTPLSVGTLLD